MRKRQPAVSHSSSNLAKKICDLIPNGPTNVSFVDYGKIEKRKGLSLFDINKATYNLWNAKQQDDYQVLVHPDTYKKFTEDTMGTCEGQVENSPVEAELSNLKYRVKELRYGIARKQEQLRIELAKLAAVKKLAKGGK